MCLVGWLVVLVFVTFCFVYLFAFVAIKIYFQYNTIAPSLHCEEPNPNISFDELMLTVPRNPVVWDTPMKVACCNSFGFGGSNCHAVLWQYLQGEDTSSSVLVSARAR